ncbi:MAG: hypothetical protein IPL31_09310 [Saprospiraceae bacterium]|nr:hypothetical protein [Saprospiraceae bacterium]
MKSTFYNVIQSLIIIFCIDNQAFADFSLVCPPDVTVSCKEDYLHDLNLFGRAYTDYNGLIQYQHDCKTIIEIDDCGKGTIKRVWGVENLENWKWLSCTQVITISNLDGFNYRDVNWPPSLVIKSCNPQADIKNLAAPYDAPSWSTPKCAKPMLSYKDTRYRVDEGCEKIVREWKILDWCQYDPINYPGRGFFTYTQVIKLISSSDTAILNCKKDTLVINNRNCDSIYVQLDSAIFESGCKIYHKIYNTSKYAVHSGTNASGYYPNGITKFYYIAEYACGTEVKCEVTIQVKNTIQPTPYCLTGVIVTLMPVDQNQDGVPEEGMVQIWASDLDKGSWHKCPNQKLTFSFSKDVLDKSKTFVCKDIGTNEVEIWVTDSLGNQEVCKTIVEVQNNNPAIPNCDGNLHGGKRSIKGEVLFYNTNPPRNVEVSIVSLNLQSQVALDKGSKFQYQFDNLDQQNAYSIKLECHQFDASAIDYNDLFYLKSILSGKQKLSSVYSYFAADVNGDHQITPDDYALLKQVVINRRYNALPKFWQMIPADFVFNHPTNPFLDIMPSDIHIKNLNHDMENQNFIAVRIGDLVSNVHKESNLSDRDRLSNDGSSINVFQPKVLRENATSSKIEWLVSSETQQYIKLQLVSIDGRSHYSQDFLLEKGMQILESNTNLTGIILYQFMNRDNVISGKLFCD